MKVLFIFGTRPEAIKMAPLIREFKKHDKIFDIEICVTAQQRQLLDQVMDFFGINPDYDLNLMRPDQSLFSFTSSALSALEPVLKKSKPDIVFVQGDTLTAFIGTLAGYFSKIKIAHIEAGLRSGEKYSPYPEEINRILTSHIADYHFAPTQKALENLRNEGIWHNVYNVGNPVIDALLLGLEFVKANEDEYFDHFGFLDFSKKIILVGLRHEHSGLPLENICMALKEIVKKDNRVELIYPLHHNPDVRKPVQKILGNCTGIHIVEPLSYPYFIWLMKTSYLILTDSGGIQEEAPSLGKPVLVMRDVSERTEGIEAGSAKLVGTSRERIVQETLKLLADRDEYEKMANLPNPYGDGKTSEKIREIITLTNTDLIGINEWESAKLEVFQV
jgi:UDP-N-acetylglucosamine 2-epimerase (non-hydrolysing)